MHPLRRASLGLPGLLFGAWMFTGAACSKVSYLEIQLTLPSAPVDFAQQVEWLDLAASDGKAFDAGPERIPAAPVAGGLGAANARVILAVSAPNGSQVHVMVNGLDQAGNAIGSASGDKLLGSGTSTLELTLAPHCAEPRNCDPAGICAGIVACDSDWLVGYGACLAESLPVPSAATACGASDAGHCDGLGACLDALCGDGVLQVDAGEECDWGTANSDSSPDHCRTDCRLPHCGDGVLDGDAGEVCDLDAGNNGRGLGCNATCTLIGRVTTLAGNGTYGGIDGVGRLAELGDPYGLAILDGALYVADTGRQAIRRVDLQSAAVTTIAGGGFDAGGGCGQLDGVGASAEFCGLYALLAFDDGGVLAGDRASLRLVMPGLAGFGSDGGTVTTLAGWIGDAGAPPSGFQAGPFTSAQYGAPWGLTRIDDVIYSNTHSQGVIAASDLESRMVTSVGEASPVSLTGMTHLATLLYTTDVLKGAILALDVADGGGKLVNFVGPAGLRDPDGLCTDGSTLYVCQPGDGTVRQIDPLTGVITLVAGTGQKGSGSVDGIGADAGFVDPANCVWDPVGHALYVSDRGGQRIRKIQ